MHMPIESSTYSLKWGRRVGEGRASPEVRGKAVAVVFQPQGNMERGELGKCQSLLVKGC